MTDIDQSNINKDECIEMMKSRSSRNFIYMYMIEIGTFIDNFNPDPYIHSRYAGQRAAGLHLQEKLKQHAPEQYKQMIREQH
tara:strand:+ start:4116 stop:4361 length:246 start_codon:yes stop_codon:yes gene_type:complete